MKQTDGCDHDFDFGGVVYQEKDRMPGSGAYFRKYFNWFFCRKCLINKYFSLDIIDSSYIPVKFNAKPKSEEK